MEIEQIKEIILSWDSMLSQRMKKYIHYRSMRNFVFHYDEIDNEKVKNRISNLLTEYIAEVNQNDFDFEAESGYFLAKKYLSPLSDYYKEYLGFTGVMKIKNVFLWGILADSLLYLARYFYNFRYLPYVTISLFLYYLFVSFFKEPKGKVYGMFY